MSMNTDQLIEKLSSNRKPKKPFRPFGTPLGLTGFAVTFLLGFGMVGLGPRSDFDVVASQLPFRFEILAGLALLASSLVLALISAVPGAIREHRGLVGFARLSLLAVIVLSSTHVIRSWLGGERISDWGSGCAVTLVGFSLLVSLPLLFVLRRGAPTQIVRSSVLASMAGFALGWLEVEFHCPNQAANHLAVGHLAAPLGVLVLLLPAIRRALRW